MQFAVIPSIYYYSLLLQKANLRHSRSQVSASVVFQFFPSRQHFTQLHLTFPMPAGYVAVILVDTDGTYSLQPLVKSSRFLSFFI
jgi:hypothetical protein